MAITDWHNLSRSTGQYHAGYFVGSTGEKGEHLRSHRAGWPFSIYIKATETGATDMVVCNGIQDIEDAHRIVYMLCQHFTYGDTNV